jgi:hypothetical protein
VESLLDDCDQHIHGDGNPYLSLHRILGSVENRFDAQVLFYPYEEQSVVVVTPVSMTVRSHITPVALLVGIGECTAHNLKM